MNETNIVSKCPVVLQSGFRIFFLGAALYTVATMFFWLKFYAMGQNVFVAMPLTVWHGHEMVFGFTMAVVAGFLLTAVTNWTGLATISSTPLMCLFLIWVMARVFAFMPSSFPLWPLVVSNLVFVVFLSVAVIRPIIKVKQWKQSAVLSKLILILLSEGVFYWALLHADLEWERKILKLAVYIIISLILTIARRIMPFFIERGVGYPVVLRNSKFMDLVSLVLIVLLLTVDVFFAMPAIVSVLSFVLVVVHVIRLTGWYTPGVLKKPLLWVLYVGYLLIIFGFLFKAFVVIDHRFEDSAMHALTAGGIGVFILGMMARVSWGHTGRNINEPPRLLSVMFSILILGVVVRVFFPLMFEKQYVLWVGVGQVFWMVAFLMYLITYIPVLLGARMDGKFG